MSYEIKEATLSGGPLSYHVAGTGKPILHLHSAGGVTITRPLDTLAESYQVFAPICPGFDGTTRWDSLASVRDWAGVVAEFAKANVGERFDVIGSSFGSWTALWLAALNPGMVDHLVLEVPAGFRFDGKGGLPLDLEARMKALYVYPENIPGGPKAPEIARGNLETYTALAGDITVDEALSEKLPDIDAVTLILLGTEDTVVPPEASAHLKRSIPVSQRIFVFDAAHSIEVDQPERVTRLWQGFLSRGRGFVLNRSADAA